MIEKNLEFLQGNLRYAGFGDVLNEELEKQFKRETDKFSIGFEAEINRHRIGAVLYFSRSDKTGLYFFNGYDLTMTREKSNDSISQYFNMNTRGSGVTLKEAYNMLNGRFALREGYNKHGEKFSAWQGIDFTSKTENGQFERKQYHENWGFDVYEALSYFPFKEMSTGGELQKLVASLEKGNLQSVTHIRDGKERKLFIAADPVNRTIIVHNNKGDRLDKKTVAALMIKQPLEPVFSSGVESEIEQLVEDKTITYDKDPAKEKDKQTPKLSIARQSEEDLEKPKNPKSKRKRIALSNKKK